MHFYLCCTCFLFFFVHTENRQSPTHVHLLCSSWLPVAGTCQTLGSTLLVVQRSHSRAGGVKRRPVRDATELSLSLQPVGMSDRCRREVGQESGEAPGLRRTQVQPGVRSSSKVVFPRTASLWVLVRQVESHLNDASHRLASGAEPLLILCRLLETAFFSFSPHI